MKQIASSFPALALLGLLAFPVQAADPQRASENRAVAPFSALELAGSFDVRVDADAPRALRLSGTAEQLADIETIVERDTLIVRQKQRYGLRFGFGKRNEGVVVTIGTPTLKSLRNTGSGDVAVERAHGEALQVTMAGSGDLHANGSVREATVRLTGSGDADLRGLRTATLRVQMNGSGDVDAAGVTQELAAVLTGSGDLDVKDLHADKVSATLNGSGSLALRGRVRELSAKLTGSGDLEAHGVDAQNVRLDLAGSGEAQLEGRTAALAANLTGSGGIDAHGFEAGTAQIAVRGTGNVVVNVRGKLEAHGRRYGGADQPRLVTVDRKGVQGDY